MKKVISAAAALALAGVMATSAFAADTGYTKDQLIEKAAQAGYTAQASSYGVDLNAAINALSSPETVDLDAVKAAVSKAETALKTADSQAEITNIINTAVSDLQAAAGNNSISVSDVSVALYLNGSAKISANVKVGGTSFAVSKTTDANENRAPEWTDSSKKDTTTGAATSGTTTSTTGVIKATGLNTAGAAAVAMAVASVLGVAAVKARKLGE